MSSDLSDISEKLEWIADYLREIKGEICELNQTLDCFRKDYIDTMDHCSKEFEDFVDLAHIAVTKFVQFLSNNILCNNSTVKPHADSSDDPQPTSGDNRGTPLVGIHNKKGGLGGLRFGLIWICTSCQQHKNEDEPFFSDEDGFMICYECYKEKYGDDE